MTKPTTERARTVGDVVVEVVASSVTRTMVRYVLIVDGKFQRGSWENLDADLADVTTRLIRRWCSGSGVVSVDPPEVRPASL